MTQVKICGVRQVEHALMAARAGADFVGLIFAPTRRLVTPEVARAISDAVHEAGVTQTVGVFVNEDVRIINARVRECALDYVQLSGDEPGSEIEQIDAPVIRVIHVRPDSHPAGLGERIAAVRAELVLLDTARAGSYGGTGETFDWTLLPRLNRPVLLAGGLHAGNVGEAIGVVRPWGVDVSSGVETGGTKDGGKIASFIATVRGSREATDGVS